jgi:SAM-dependent methyltransferase
MTSGPQASDGHQVIFDKRFAPYLSEHGRPRYRRMLDVGGGPAGYGLCYRELADEVIVCDLHDRTDSYVGSGVQFQVADITRPTPFADQSLDLVVSHSTFEHIDDVPAALGEIDRLLHVKGHAFITIRPLYYSPLGFHRRDFQPWDHLRDGSDPQVPDGHLGSYLNRLTYAEMLAAVGALGWRILDFTPKYASEVPDDDLTSRYPTVDLLGMEFFALFEKIR